MSTVHPSISASDTDALLTPELLSAMMRSTWTWDDRALRRDLSTLLVRLDTARLVEADSGVDDAFSDALHSQALTAASAFVATVLGPKLVADTGNPLRGQFLQLATTPGAFARRASTALQGARVRSDEYLRKHAGGIKYAPESTWSTLVATDGAAGLATAMRAYGHQLSDSAFFANKALAWQAASAVTRCDVASGYAQRLQTGEITATLAAAEQTGSWDPVLVRTRAELSPDGWVLTGQKHYVPGADSADVILVIARSTAGPSLFAVETGSRGATVSAHDVIDSTRPLFGITLAETPATLLGVEGSGGRLMWDLIDRATTALAGEQVGLIEAAIAILHAAAVNDDRCAAEIALAHSAAHALWQRAVAEPSPHAAAMAHIGCSTAAMHAVTVVAQVCDNASTTTPLVLRAISGSLLFGGPALSHERLLDRLGI